MGLWVTRRRCLFAACTACSRASARAFRTDSHSRIPPALFDVYLTRARLH